MTNGIYPVEWAEMTKERAGQKYQPSNGTEGCLFMDQWCGKCARDKTMSEGKDFDECADDETCSIIANTMVFSVDDEEYPSEWQYGADGQPCCTAFVSVNGPLDTVRDDLTIDMFAGKS